MDDHCSDYQYGNIESLKTPVVRGSSMSYVTEGIELEHLEMARNTPSQESRAPVYKGKVIS